MIINILNFIKKLSPNIPKYILGDPLRLKQILLNLLTNAIKFTSKGYVCLLIQEEYHKYIKYINLLYKILALVLIKQPKLNYSKLLTQADASTSRQYWRTGLGLAISQRLVNLMGGNININSEVS